MLLLFLLIGLVVANLAKFDENRYSQVCAGVYSKYDWGGSIKPHIGITLNKYDDLKYNEKDKDNKEQGHDKGIIISYVIFEYKDLDNIGYDLGNGQKKYICDDSAIEINACTEGQKNNFILNSNTTNSTVYTSHLSHLGPAAINYHINRTGYYCISTFTRLESTKYQGSINFQNAFGQLSASEIPKLPGYGILTICYAIALALFGFQFFKKRKENQILPLQKYLLAMLGFLTFDTLVVWSYYDLINRIKSPSNGFARFYMVFLAIFNAIKITFSFFLLLCISLGYGVVVLKLKKKTMTLCKILAGFNFAASLVYLIFNYYDGSSMALVSTENIDDSDAGGFLGLIPMIPISITLTIYYITILSSIRKTTQSLHQQRQIIKLQLYQNLFKIIFFAVILTFLGLTLSSFIYLSMSTTEMFEQHWKSSFFIFDFWPSCVFFFVFLAIAWLWRPTETSYMLAISRQLSTGEGVNDDEGENQQNGHEFELDDLSLMSHDDEENTETRVDRDSFEIGESSTNKRDTEQPPDYDDLSIKQPVESNSTNNNTLFELGEDDSDHENENENDDRLKVDKKD
ncbi:unnamed protein product [Candida verbasci]|uniref:Membrane protein PTM1 n=1 Tax=Candida verbasci TaxID=1227364 RepID=A0A9W4TTC9_9ASCO|nr:unnamed protein product [Candida verbasci]